MGDRPTVLVIGAGIGGLTTALAVARAGFDVAICERATELSELGAGIQVSPNAGRVLADLGLDDAIRSVAIEPEAIDVMSGVSGSRITSLPVSAFRSRYGFPYRVIHRADLQSILAAAVRKATDITLLLGTTVEAVLNREGDSFVRLKGPRGELVQAAAVIGADGVWSSTREQVAGSHGPVATGRTAWRTTIPRDNVPEGVPANRVVLWLGPYAHLVHYPIAGGAAVNVVAVVEENWDKPGWNARGDYRRIAERFNNWPQAVRTILAAPQGWQKWALAGVDPTGAWVDGNTALLGDAAHAMVPFLAQGAAMAIEDAAVVADCLKASPADIPAALAAYEAARKPRVVKVWNAAKRTGEHYHMDGTLARLRDVALGLLGSRLVLAQNDWIYRWRADTPTDGA